LWSTGTKNSPVVAAQTDAVKRHQAIILAMLTTLTGSRPWAITPATATENLETRFKAEPPGVKPLEAPGIHNLFALGTNVFSGSTPARAEGFAALAKLGVKTIISVDGAQPEVELARQHGLRYVHLPHGYDGISTNLQLQLAKAARVLPGPIYVHCHHGKHRGPAAAAVICLADQGWNKAQAEAFLVAAGTATNYAGLYEVVREFQRPTEEQLAAVSADLPETAQVSGLVEAMVLIDERWEHLKAVRAAGYRAPPQHPDIQPANEAVILWEHYRESRRLPETIAHGPDLIKRFEQAELEAQEAERLLRMFAVAAKPEHKPQLDRTFDALAKSCSTCHQAFRDRRQP
jgi:protein tyrosine phosphatase (PTP) superfamily phosphohydrolase (DUF442 family)